MTIKKKAQEQTEGKVDERAIADLAEKISAVLMHPALPEHVYNRIVDGLNECDTTTAVHSHVGYVKAILIEHAKRGGE